MNLQRYQYKIIQTHLEYEFVSSGSKGDILKRVTFTSISPLWYNLGFGDVDITTDEMIDDAISNNGDMHMVLATVAAIVYDFMSENKTAIVVAKGVDAIRNRLYRMSINSQWLVISAEYEVFGWRNGQWEVFSREKTYDAFFIQQRKV